MQKRSKIAIVGAGMVGSATAFSLLQAGVAQELLLIDRNTDKAEGEAMDLSHGVPLAYAVQVKAGTYEDCQGADIVIITAGAAQKPGETRLDLVKKNTAIMKDIIPQVVRHTPESILIVVTNPVDVLTYAALKISNFPESRVIGSGTVLDSSRLRYALSLETGVDTRNIHAYVLGEHGDTEFVAWSRAHVAGTPLAEYYANVLGRPLDEKTKSDLARHVREAAYDVIDKKGATYYAVALALNRTCRAILRGERSVLTVSTRVEGIYGVPDVCLSIPCVVGRGGVEKKIPFHLDDEEVKNWQKSARAMAEFTESLPIE
jgi:L-lactate dehydrogenase